MNIALVAHDRKKELMVQFCIAYRGTLEKHNLFATGVTGKLVAEEAELKVHRFYAGAQGGAQQIAARLQYNEIDMLLFFRDPKSPNYGDRDDRALMRLCDENNIPVATNMATAEVLIHGLERGDLDWRNIVNPKNSR